jgi:ABC-type nitrate/sulfonate/bicarbonate transport system substrate-binding protein
MRIRLSTATVIFFILLSTVICPVSLFAASAPTKIVVTYGGLNERSGVLFVAKDAGIFQKHGLDAQVVNVRSGAVGLSALAAGETQFHGGSATGAYRRYGGWTRFGLRRRAD